MTVDPQTVVDLLGTAAGAGLLLGGFVALMNAWLP